MKNSKAIPVILGVMGFVFALPMIAGAEVMKQVFAKSEQPDLDLILFFVFQLPSLIGFVSSISSPWAPRVAGVFMLISGSIIVVPGLIFGSIVLGFMTGFLYILGGILSVFVKNERLI